RTIGFRETAGNELGATLRWRLGAMQILAFSIPTVGSLALLWTTDSNIDWGFRLLASSLSLLGITGAIFMGPITRKMRRFVELLSTDHGTRRDGHIPTDPALSTLSPTVK